MVDGIELSFLIRHSLYFGFWLSLTLALVMLLSILIAADMWVGDYPPDIRAKYGEMSPRGMKYRPIIGALFFGSILAIETLSIIRLRSIPVVGVGFFALLLSTFVILMVFNTFDLLIVDWLIFVLIQPKWVILPGTEGLAGYKDYQFHFRGFLVGILFSAGGALVLSLVALVILRLIG